MTDKLPPDDPPELATQGPIKRLRGGVEWLKQNRERVFWWWVLYQAVKGMVTLTVIWIPLFMIWLGLRGN